MSTWVPGGHAWEATGKDLTGVTVCSRPAGPRQMLGTRFSPHPPGGLHVGGRRLAEKVCRAGVAPRWEPGPYCPPSPRSPRAPGCQGQEEGLPLTALSTGVDRGCKSPRLRDLSLPSSESPTSVTSTAQRAGSGSCVRRETAGGLSCHARPALQEHPQSLHPEAGFPTGVQCSEHN